MRKKQKTIKKTGCCSGFLSSMPPFGTAMMYRKTVSTTGLMTVDDFSPTSSRPVWERGPVLEGGEGGGRDSLSQLGLTVSYFVFHEVRKYAKQVTVLPSSDLFAKFVSHAFLENTKYKKGNCPPYCRCESGPPLIPALAPGPAHSPSPARPGL